MKKFIQILSILSVIVAFSIISANAQTVQRYNAKIPFDFNIGNKSYQAGDYVLKVSLIPAGRLLVIEDTNRNYLQQVLIVEKGQSAKKSSELLFSRYDNQWTLSKLLTTDRGFTVPAAKNKKQLAATAGASSDIISVELR